MNAQERFEQYIDEIEDLAEKNECLKPYNIADEITTSHGIGIRDLTAVFSFLTESSLTSYINVVPNIYTAWDLIDVIDLVGEIKIAGYDPLSFPPDFLKLFVKEDSMNFKEFNDLAEKYKIIHGELDSFFPEFLLMYKCGLISDNTIREEDCMESNEDASFAYIMSEDDYDDPMLRWINEETNYANSDRFDDDYDEDSAYYEGNNFW